jgi:hypothetical protein
MRGKHDLLYLLKDMIGDDTGELVCRTHDCLKVGDLDRGIICSHLGDFIILAVHLSRHECEDSKNSWWAESRTKAYISLPVCSSVRWRNSRSRQLRELLIFATKRSQSSLLSEKRTSNVGSATAGAKYLH